ncbi:hypothetical protein B0H16DRAFT_1751759 [Mycena metata]|uniref:F-box domain-containing protein n=1 Tax=Mycena metata TaxID=1033252 RepID=A0AAD7DJN3_9AGAR|nr:hypothetical protein B0H16DRAFT_1751759 [Mycena metata]
MSKTALSHLPTEVGIRIFKIVLYPEGQFSFTEFVGARWLVCRSSSQWLRIVKAYPAFWTHIRIDLETSAEVVETYLDRAGTMPINLCLDFHSIDNYFEAHREVQTVQQLVDERMTIVQKMSHRVQLIILETEDRELYDCMQDALCMLHAPILRDLMIRFTHIPSQWDYGALNRPGWSASNLPAMERVHLYGTLFPFPFASPQYATLKELRIFEVPKERPISFTDFQNIITESPNLEELTLWGIYCTEVQSRPITSTSIHTLRIRFGPGTSFASLVSNFDFPALRNVEAEIAHQNDIDSAVLCAQLWTRVTRLKIRDNGRDMHGIPALFDLFRSVTHLDATECEGSMLSELTRYSDFHIQNGRTTVFGELQSFMVAHAAGREVLQFCLRHGAKERSDGHDLKLKEVVMVHVGEPHGAHATSVEWMKVHIQKFILRTVEYKPRESVETEVARVIAS